MPVQLLCSEDASALLAPVQHTLDSALARLADGPPLAIALGDCSGFSALSGDQLTLSTDLAGPAVHHPDEPSAPLPPVDRWRRAALCVLEAVVNRSLPPDDGPAWRRTGAMLNQVDVAAPELGLRDHELTHALHRGDLGAHPRGGLLLHTLSAPLDPLPDPRQWLELGRRAYALATPVPIQRPRLDHVPDTLGPWRWVTLELAPTPRGGRIGSSPEAAVQQRWVTGGQPHRTLVATAGHSRLSFGPGVPCRGWEVASVQAFGQTLGAKGITWRFVANGQLELILADSFVGTVDAVEMADKVGTSGLVQGRWCIAGPRTVALSRIVPMGLTVHGEGGFLVPAQTGEGSWVHQLEGARFQFRRHGERLHLRGPLMGGPVEIRFRPEPG